MKYLLNSLQANDAYFITVGPHSANNIDDVKAILDEKEKRITLLTSFLEAG